MRTCVICGAPLTARQQRYCSRPCAIKGNTIDRRENPERWKKHRERAARWQKENREKANGYKATETRECEVCGTEFTCRADAPNKTCGDPICKATARKGETPRSRIRWHECPTCGRTFLAKSRGHTYCSTDCSRSPLRRAIESGDIAAVAAALRERTVVAGEFGCWVWTGGLDPDGYPRSKFGRRSVSLYRLVAQVAEQRSAKGHAVHHKCANRACLNPAHLQIVTHQQNLAEMLKRQWYEQRIADLESALREVEPRHPLVANLRLVAEA